MAIRFKYKTQLSKPSTGGKCSVIIRVSSQGKRADLYTGITLLPVKRIEKRTVKQWDEKKGRIRQGVRIDGYEYHVLNSQLNEQEQFIEDYFNNAAARNAQVSVVDLKKRFNYKYKSKTKERSNEFFYLFDAYIDERKDDWGKDMKAVVTRLRNRIRQIKPEICFTDLSIATMEEIKRELSLSMFNDALIKHLSYLKSFVLWARSKNYIINEEFFCYKPKLPKAKKAVRYLELYELEALCNLDLSKPGDEALDKTRDFFVFQCYTALRYSDIKQLKRQSITRDEGRGCYVIDLVTEKDDDRVTYRLAKKAEEIYLKYAGYVYDNDLAFPVISNQKYNEHLKELGKRADLQGEWIDVEYRLQEKIEVKIPKADLTSHTARRTFIVTALNEGVSLDLIALITSHSDIKAMQPYIKANRKGTDSVIDAMDNAKSKKQTE